MEAKEFLSQIRGLEVRIAAKLAELQRWKSMAQGLGNGAPEVKVRFSRDPGGLDRVMAGIQETQEALAGQLLELRQRQNQVLQVLESLESGDEYQVLHMRFVRGWPPARVAQELGRSPYWVWRLQKSGLERVQAKLDASKLQKIQANV